MVSPQRLATPEHHQQEGESNRGGIYIGQTPVGKHHDRDGSHRRHVVVQHSLQALRRNPEETLLGRPSLGWLRIHAMIVSNRLFSAAAAE